MNVLQTPEPRPVSSRPLQQLDAQISGQWWGTEEPHVLRHLPVEPSLQPHRPRRADTVVKAMAKRDLPRLKGKRHQRIWAAICGHWHQHAANHQHLFITCSEECLWHLHTFVMITELKDLMSWVISPLKIRRKKMATFIFQSILITLQTLKIAYTYKINSLRLSETIDI